jgi:hypothetical protein
LLSALEALAGTSMLFFASKKEQFGRCRDASQICLSLFFFQDHRKGKGLIALFLKRSFSLRSTARLLSILFVHFISNVASLSARR